MQLNENHEPNFSINRFEKMLKTNSVFFFDSIEFERIIEYYLELAKISLAKKAIKIGLNQHPKSTTLLLFEVEILVFENKLDEADKLLNRLYHLDPNNDELYIQKATVQSKRNKHQEAISTLKIALKLSEDKIDVYGLLGMEYLFIEEFENAKKCYQLCLADDNQDYAALYNIIYCFDFLEQHNEAIKFLNEFLENNPYSEVGWHQLGKQYLSVENLKQALTSFDFSIISDDTFIGAYFEKGKVLEKLARYSEAIDNYLLTLQLDDPTSFAYLRIGKCYEKLKNKEMAIQYYYKTVHEDPLLDKGWEAITDYYYKLKDYNKALFYTNKAITIDPHNISYWKRYAQINYKLDFYEEAERGYLQIIELGNYELKTWLKRSDILLQIGEIDTSIQVLLQGLEFYPDDAEIEFRLSGLYYLKNEPQKGQYHLVNALQSEKEFVIILEELFSRVYNRKSVQEIIHKYL